MKNFIRFCFVLAIIFTVTDVSAQETKVVKSTNYLDLSWGTVANKMPDEWYGSDDAKKVAENVLFCQMDIGGWAKNKPYHHVLSADEKADISKGKSGIGATIDNEATTMEMRFLTKMYAHIKDERYRKSFNDGFNYLLKAQYANGGFPQFFPFRVGKTVAYASHITYNDNAMVNVLKMLRDVAAEAPFYAPMQMTADMKTKAKMAYDKGIDCILKTQIKVKKQLTVWCAQHDEFTLAPANARSYELASFSGGESVGITMFLMEIDNPSQPIKDAVNASVKWFEEHKIEGIKLNPITNAEGQKDLVVVEDKNAPTLWARFYDLDTAKPYFCDRDGIKKETFAELGYNRRNGYGWYTEAPEKLLAKYPKWAEKWHAK